MTLIEQAGRTLSGAPDRRRVPPAFPGWDLCGAGAGIRARPLDGRRVGRLALALLASSWLFGATYARAASVLIIVRPANTPPVMVETLVRLKGELISAGFETEIVDGGVAPSAAGDSRARLEQLAARRGADAVVAIVGDLSPDSVEVWVIDKVTGKSVVRRVPFEPEAARASETLALRAIELLRSSFLEIDLAAHDRRNQTGRRAAVRSRPLRGDGSTRQTPREARRRGRGRRGHQLGRCRSRGVAARALRLVVAPVVCRPGIAGRPRDAPDRRGPGGQRAGGANVWAARRQPSFPRGPAAASFRDGVRRRAAYGGRGTRRRAEPGPRRGPMVLSRRRGPRCAAAACPIASTCRWRRTLQVAEPYLAVRFVDTVVATSARPNLLLTLTVGAWL